MNIDSTQHFDFSDDEETPMDERTSAVNELFKQVKEKAKLTSRNASSLGEYVKAFLLDYYYSDFAGLAWLYDKSKGQINADAIVGDFETVEKANEIDKTTSAIEEMYDRVSREPDRAGYVRVAVRKIRKGSEVTGLRVLAIFPNDSDIPRAGFDEAYIGDDKSQVVYYEPQKACWRHAVDDARNAANENGGVYYLPIQNTQEAQNSLHADSNGNVEYVISRTDDGERVKQSMDSYLWVALVRKAEGENKHFLVSDFINRN